MSGPLSEARDAALFVFLLRLGDSALVLGQRLAGWTAHGPALEEDLALTNVALDLVGHARMWLDYAGEVEGRGRDADRLAYFRDQSEYRNVLLVERPNGNYADTTARQFLFDTWHLYLLQALGASRDEGFDQSNGAFRPLERHLKPAPQTGAACHWRRFSTKMIAAIGNSTITVTAA